VAIVWAIADLYVSGHSIAVPLVRGRPLHRWATEILFFVVPLVVAGYVFWKERPPAP